MRPTLRVFVAVLIATFVAVLSPHSAQANTPVSWSTPAVITPSFGNMSVVDQSVGITLAVWMDGTGVYGNTSSDNGQTWGQQFQITVPSPSNVSGLNMTAVPAGGFALAVANSQTNQLQLLTSNSSGRNWSQVGSQSLTLPDSVSITPVGNDRVAISVRSIISGFSITSVSVSDAGVHSLPAFAQISPLGVNSWWPEIASNSGIITTVWGNQANQLGTRSSSDFGATWSSATYTNTGFSYLTAIDITPCNGQFVASLMDLSTTNTVKIFATPASTTPSWSMILASPGAQSPGGFSTVCTSENRLVTAFSSYVQADVYWATSTLVSGAWTPTSYNLLPAVNANNVVLAAAPRGQVAMLSNDWVDGGTSSIYRQYWDPLNGWSTPELVQQSSNIPSTFTSTQTPTGAIFSWAFLTNDGMYDLAGPRTSINFTNTTDQPLPTPTDELAKTGISTSQYWVGITSGFALLSLAVGLVLLKKSSLSLRKL